MSGDARLTITVPEAGRKYFNIGTNASYAAAGRGEIPTIRVGRLLRVPVRAMEQNQLALRFRPGKRFRGGLARKRTTVRIVTSKKTAGAVIDVDDDARNIDQLGGTVGIVANEKPISFQEICVDAKVGLISARSSTDYWCERREWWRIERARLGTDWVGVLAFAHEVVTSRMGGRR
jgi:hypothetical protein